MLTIFLFLHLTEITEYRLGCYVQYNSKILMKAKLFWFIVSFRNVLSKSLQKIYGLPLESPHKERYKFITNIEDIYKFKPKKKNLFHSFELYRIRNNWITRWKRKNTILGDFASSVTTGSYQRPRKNPHFKNVDTVTIFNVFFVQTF